MGMPIDEAGEGSGEYEGKEDREEIGVMGAELGVKRGERGAGV